MTRHSALGVSALVATMVVVSAAIAVGPGDRAPELSVERWHNSGPMTMDELRGKVVILDFWGVWCVPCIKAIPKLERLQRELGGDGLRIIAIHTPNKAELIESFVREKKMTLAIAVDGLREATSTANYGDTTNRYLVSAFPAYVVIDRAGLVRARPKGVPSEELIKKLLAGGTSGGRTER